VTDRGNRIPKGLLLHLVSSLTYIKSKINRHLARKAEDNIFLGVYNHSVPWNAGICLEISGIAIYWYTGMYGSF